MKGSHSQGEFLNELRASSNSLKNVDDLSALLDELGGARVVMLGEATHGTREFYEWRRLISMELVRNHGFRFIAAESDWPASHAVHTYITGADRRPESVRQALLAFRRWPTWMWANEEVVALMEDLRIHNLILNPEERVGFFGLDLYSLYESIDAVLGYLESINPDLARRIQKRYACFEPFERDEIAYARSTLKQDVDCEDAAVKNLQELLDLRLKKHAANAAQLLSVQENAKVVRNAELYYRTMMQGDEQSWNIRDQHMMEVLLDLLEHYGPSSRGIVWAHNTHIGDYRATDMEARGYLNLGGIAREELGDENVRLVGFSTYRGRTIASNVWDGPALSMPVPEARSGSLEDFLHQVSVERREKTLQLIFHGARVPKLRESPLGHRAIGVVYDPRRDRPRQYVPTRVANRYDAMIFIDESSAVTPFSQPFDESEIPEAWPTGF